MEEKWLEYLTDTKETNVNLERVNSIKEINNTYVYDYINRCLNYLEKTKCNKIVYNYVKETLKWSDVSKTGSKKIRKKWKALGFDLFTHNIGSAQIYKYDNKDYDEIIYILIKTHGLIGQYIRGEVPLISNRELYTLIENKLIDKSTLRKVLIVLNKCIVKSVSEDLYKKIELEIINTIDLIINNQFDKEYNIIERIHRLNSNINNEDEIYLKDQKIIKALEETLSNKELWYYEVALGSFTLLEQIKILLIIKNNINNSSKIITFLPIMKKFYLDYDNKKVINIYKKRVIETVLKELEIEDLLNGIVKPNPHVKLKITNHNNIISINFIFSKEITKLIEFCEVAYTSNTIYNKAVYMLYDLLGFRKDDYDRFYNEIDYLNTMNLSMSNKKILLDYISGNKILDVGPGGGGLMNLIEEKNSSYKVYGIDISHNVLEELKKKKIKEKRNWILVKGDALNLENYFEQGSLDTIIYSSIIHELFSYINYNGKKFNIETVVKTLKSAYNIIPIGGRIIIRDGIKTEPINQYRIIEFKNKDDLNILNNYCKDFKGRKITYELINENKVKMLVNDAMEFLYTYTWGENSYSLEVQEQFGYLTPSEYIDLIEKNLEKAKIIKCYSFLQDGYEQNLLNKITLYDEDEQITKLPDSTCIIVIEKGK